MSILKNTEMFLHTENWIPAKADLYLSVMKPNLWAWLCQSCTIISESENSLTAVVCSWNDHILHCGLDLVTENWNNSTINGGNPSNQKKGA